MTEDRLRELEALDAARTTGEWKWTGSSLNRGTDYILWPYNSLGDGEDVSTSQVLGAWGDSAEEKADENIHFIAACSTAVPELISEVRALRGLLRRSLLALAIGHNDYSFSAEFKDLFAEGVE